MKKVLSLVLVVAFVMGMATIAGAASTSIKATGLVYNLQYGYSGHPNSTLSGDTVTYSDDIVPNEEFEDYIYLHYSMFTFDDAAYQAYPEWTEFNTASRTYNYNNVRYTAPSGSSVGLPAGSVWQWTGKGLISESKQYLSAAVIRNSKITVRTSVSAGSRAIDEVKINNREGRIEVIFNDEFVSTKELDFDFTVYLVFGSKRWSTEGLAFVGTYANELIEMYEEDDYVDLSNGAVAEAMEFVPTVEVDLGNGVSIHTKMFKSKKYYGTANRDQDEDALVVFEKYPDIDNVVTLKTIGLNSTGDIVSFNTDYDKYYVYDADLNYLGVSTELLPYSTKYYLANRMLDIEDDDVNEGSVPSTDIENPSSGGDDVFDNVNDNPGTGC